MAVQEGSLIETDHARLQKERIIKTSSRRAPFLLCRATTANWFDVDGVTIDILPDDVLLEIFDHYVAQAERFGQYEKWRVLVHVCQKWRYVVFASPLRLNLRILCSARTPVGEKLAVWPFLPIFIQELGQNYGDDNIIAALGHNDRICKITLTIPQRPPESVFAAMQQTFVALKDLELYGTYDTVSVVSDSYLGGSAPDLRRLILTRVPFTFPVLRKLLLSAPNLVILVLTTIPRSSYFSPEAIVTCLSALTRLNRLRIEFKYAQSRPPQGIRHPPSRRSVLPALARLKFIGVCEYLEDLVSRIDAPLLDHLFIRFFHQPIFDIPQLVRFISHTPSLEAYDEAYLIFSNRHAAFILPGRENQGLELGILCRRPDEQLSSLVQVCTSSFTQALVPMLEHLHMLENKFLRPRSQAGLEHNLWLEILRSFSTVKNLYLSRDFVPHIVSTLQEPFGERGTEVLPNLQSIFLEGVQESVSVPESIRQFIAARQLSNRPITISHWVRQDG